MSTYSFLRWLREGATAAVATPRSAAGLADRAAFGVQVNVADDTGHTTTAFRTFTMFGPGDVIGLDARQILRSAPVPGAVDAEYEQLAHVEFDRPDLPWMFTPFHEERTEPAAPARPAGSPVRALVTTGTLLPWLVLVVVEQRDGVTLGYRPGALLPVLHVDDASRELPDLTQAHAFAHVQIAGDLPTDASAFDRLLDGQPERTLSRLLCPRLLRPATGYLACLVPAFEAGRLAGLGREVTGIPAAALAWDRAKATPVDLPVYHHWTFTTASDAGFETLVRRLVPRGDLPGVGVRPLDVSSPGFGLPPAPVGVAAVVEVGGALRVPLAPAPAGADADLRDAIADVVDRVDRVAPPMYGRWHAAVAAVPRGTDDPAWLRRLNTEPALRVAAGLGTRVVQAEQEALMAAAWEQLGEVLRANQLLRQGQLALHVSGRVYSRHIAPLPRYALLQLAGPALSRLRAADGVATIRGRIAASCLPLVTLHASFRRVVRPGGPLFRRATRGADRPTDRLSVERLLASLMNGGLPATAPPPPVPTVALTATDRAAASAAFGTGDAGPEQHARARVGAALAMLAARAAGGCTPATEDLAAIARQRLAPAQTVPARVTAQLTLPAGLWDPGPGLDPVMAAPELPAPMYLPLVEQGQDWLLPGLEHVPPNTAAGLEANSEFIEAYLVGLNVEMGRSCCGGATRPTSGAPCAAASSTCAGRASGSPRPGSPRSTAGGTKTSVGTGRRAPRPASCCSCAATSSAGSPAPASPWSGRSGCALRTGRCYATSTGGRCAARSR